MPRWAVGLIVVPLALCVTCTALGLIVGVPWVRSTLSKGQTAVSNEMATAVASTIVLNHGDRAPASDRLVLTALDLNVNNTITFGEPGFEYGTEGTWIYGLTTEITADRIVLHLGEEITYSGVPVVEDGRVELTDAEASSDLMDLFLSEESFARGMENGINRALDEMGLTPVAITLRPGAMTITTGAVG